MQEPSPRISSTPPLVGASPEDYRGRLVEGMGLAMIEKAYADVTIADIVKHSRVSKRTFYEHFADKEACFLASYQSLVDELLRRAAEATAARGLEEALSSSVTAYFDALQERAHLIRPFFTDVQSMGPAALKMRRESHERFADLIRAAVEAITGDTENARAISRLMSVALVGGINELVLLSIEEGTTHEITRLGPTAIEFLRSVINSAQVPVAAAQTTEP